MSRDNIGLQLKTVPTKKDEKAAKIVVLLHHIEEMTEGEGYTDIGLTSGKTVRVEGPIAHVVSRTERYGALKIDKE